MLVLERQVTCLTIMSSGSEADWPHMDVVCVLILTVTESSSQCVKEGWSENCVFSTEM